MADEIRIIRGTPTDEELAALVGVLLTRAAPVAGSPGATPAEEPVSRWGRSARPQHPLGTRGREAWRASALPR